MRPKPQTKSDKVKLLLRQGWSDVHAIKDVAGCSLRLVYGCQQESRAIQRGRRLDTIEHNLQRLNQDVSDIRKLVLKLQRGKDSIKTSATRAQNRQLVLAVKRFA